MHYSIDMHRAVYDPSNSYFYGGYYKKLKIDTYVARFCFQDKDHVRFPISKAI